VEKGLGFSGGRRDRTVGASRAGDGLQREVEGGADRRGQPVSGRGEEAAVPFRCPLLVGLRPHVGLGRNGSQSLFALFFVLLIFFFCFPFLSKPFHKSSKTIQIEF
jgi:hypothetical protein